MTQLCRIISRFDLLLGVTCSLEDFHLVLFEMLFFYFYVCPSDKWIMLCHALLPITEVLLIRPFSFCLESRQT